MQSPQNVCLQECSFACVCVCLICPRSWLREHTLTDLNIIMHNRLLIGQKSSTCCFILSGNCNHIWEQVLFYQFGDKSLCSVVQLKRLAYIQKSLKSPAMVKIVLCYSGNQDKPLWFFEDWSVKMATIHLGFVCTQITCQFIKAC